MSQQGETNGNHQPAHRPGVYKHTASGVEVFLDATADVGTPVIDAFVQNGYVRVDGSPEVEPVAVSATPVKK